ncbi:hypothetical protein KY360_06760 [Candidatus Woesearchaeota archaeon]|nr:hypothetical protein [Candidatus Woesearchaeota archaeon]
MATFLDVTGLQYFTNFFVFIFVWLAIYALLGFTKVLGDNKGIHIIAGLIVALLVILSPITTGAIAFISPWFAIVLVLMVFIITTLKVFGVSTSEIASAGQLKVGFLAVILLILVIGVLSYIREESSIPEGEEIDYSKSTSIIFHPKVLGIVFILLIAVFTIVLMAGKQT